MHLTPKHAPDSLSDVPAQLRCPRSPAQVYETVMINDDAKKTGKIVKKLGLTVPPRQLRGTDSTQKLRAVMRAWLPLAGAVLGMVAKHLPSPTESATSRIDKVRARSAVCFRPWPPCSRCVAPSHMMSHQLWPESLAPTSTPEVEAQVDHMREAVAKCASTSDDVRAVQ